LLPPTTRRRKTDHPDGKNSPPLRLLALDHAGAVETRPHAALCPRPAETLSRRRPWPADEPPPRKDCRRSWYRQNHRRSGVGVVNAGGAPRRTRGHHDLPAVPRVCPGQPHRGFVASLPSNRASS
ncbi:Unknown protein, partial [Striga hermonthica]